MRRLAREAAFCFEALEDALARHGKPEIFNTDQDSQFTGAAFTGTLASNGIAISMEQQRSMAGQRVRRAVLAQRQIRVGASAGLRKRQRGAGLDRQLSRNLLMADVHPRALTAVYRIKLASVRCQSAWRPNAGRRSAYRRGDSVQTTGTSSNRV